MNEKFKNSKFRVNPSQSTFGTLLVLLASHPMTEGTVGLWHNIEEMVKI